VWETRKMQQAHEVLEKEDPYSYYRGKSEEFQNLNSNERAMRSVYVGVPTAAFLGFCFYIYDQEQKQKQLNRAKLLEEGDEQVVTNWSATHSVTTRRFFQPQDLGELEELVKKAHKNKTRLHVIGAGLSPNGIGLDGDGMINMSLMDKVLAVDKEKKQITVQAGARVSQVLEALKPYGLTLQNLASISEQQIGGFMQVSAHGTGASLPPVDEQVVAMKIVTPGQGTLTVSADDADPTFFRFARVAMGCMGVVAEVTLQCVPAHKLIETTRVVKIDELVRNHETSLKENRHLRYMWIPYTDDVVVVTCNLAPSWFSPSGFISNISNMLFAPKPQNVDERLKPMRDLLVSSSNMKLDDIAFLSLAQLRDELIKVNPLSMEHIRNINRAEAECWRRSQGQRVAWSEQVLGFECGGQQWVSEVCFPVKQHGDTPGDLNYVREIMQMIESQEVPAPAPLEQRWTSRSLSPMSPAHSKDETQIFSWLGIIMYLPTDEQQTRKSITEAFEMYKNGCHDLWERYGCKEHWAKIEAPQDPYELQAKREKLRQLYPLDEFNDLRKKFDPHEVLPNDLLRKLL